MSTADRSITSLPSGYRLGDFEVIDLIAGEGQAQIYLARRFRTQPPSLQRLIQRRRTARFTPEEVKREQLCIIKLATPQWIESVRDEHSYLNDPNARHPRLIRLLSEQELSTNAITKKPGPRGLGFVTLSDTSKQPVTLPYLLLPYEPGGSLRDLLEQRKRQPLPVPFALAIALQIGEALTYLHEYMGLVHHDLSPSNIVFRRALSPFVPQAPDCVLIDLAAADRPSRPRLRQIYGRQRYLPPERHATPPASIDWSIDTYALGVIIYEMLVGELPNRTTAPIGAGLTRLPPIRERRPDLSQALTTLIDAVTNHDPRQRPNLASLLDQLAQLPEAKQSGRVRGPWNQRARISSSIAGLIAAGLLAIGMTIAGTTTSQPIEIPTTAPLATMSATATSIPVTPKPTLLPTSTPARVIPTPTP